MLKVQVLNNISSLGLDKFSSDVYDVSVKNNNPDAIIVRSAKIHELETGENLKAIAEEEANILDMINKSRGEVAYTLIDLENEISIKAIENIRG